MTLLYNLLQRQVVHSYSTKTKQVCLDFMLEEMKCHKDDKHDIKGLNTEVKVPPFACSFNSSLLHGHMLAVANEEGGVCLYDVRKKGPSAKLKGWVAHSNAIFDIAWVCNEPKLVTASGDQTARLWDIQQSLQLAVFKGHSCSLKSVYFQDENLFIFATGARDGNVMVWDTRCNKRDGHYKPVNTIHNCHSTQTTTVPSHRTPPLRNSRRARRLSNVVKPDSQQSVTSVIFQDGNTLISAGAVDGNVKVWDLRKNYSTFRTEPQPYSVFPYPGTRTRKHGYSSLTLDSSKSKLFANCTNDVIYMYDCVTYQTNPLLTFRGHSNDTFYVKSSVSADDQYLMSGSGDGDAYIWRIDDYAAAPFHLTGHSNEVTCVAWCPMDQTKVVTCSDDNSLKIWRVNHAEKNNCDFVGWCERKPNPPLLTELKDDLSTKSPSLLRSPTTSQSVSATCSPVSLQRSPVVKPCSPQQFLQNWLQLSDNRSSPSVNSRQVTNPSLRNPNIEASSCNKRQREKENTTNESKRLCLNPRMDRKHIVKQWDVNCLADCEAVGKDLSVLDDKENMDVNVNSASATLSESQSATELKANSSKPTQATESHCENAMTKQDANQSECKKAETVKNRKKSNWLRDMGVKKKTFNKVAKRTEPPSQPSSPQSHEVSNTHLVARLNTKSIKDYFLPKSFHENSSRKN